MKIHSTISPFISESLWWPRGIGSQPLYRLNVTFIPTPTPLTTPLSNLLSHASDNLTTIFGIRQLNVTVDQKTGGALFVCNGVRVFIRGGNWIVSEGMYRGVLFCSVLYVYVVFCQI
jgi:mannosylglycoprotein endo-beta-mannosidase